MLERCCVFVSALNLLCLLLFFLDYLSKFDKVFFLVNELLKQQVSIVLLTHILDFQLAVLLHQVPVLVIDFLSNLSHCLKMIVQFLLLLLEVVLVLLLLLSLCLQLLLDILKLLVKGRPDIGSLLPKILGCILLNRSNCLCDLIIPVVYLPHVLLIHMGFNFEKLLSEIIHCVISIYTRE